MTKVEFDKWFANNYDFFVNKLSKQYHQTKEQIMSDLSDFYIHVVDGDRLHKIEDFKGYLFSFIYYRHYQFFAESKASREGYIVNNKRVSIKITDTLEEFFDLPEAEHNDSLIEEHLDNIDSIIKKLSYDDQILYKLYYVEGFTMSEIGEKYGLQKPWISRKLKKIREKVKQCLEN